MNENGRIHVAQISELTSLQFSQQDLLLSEMDYNTKGKTKTIVIPKPRSLWIPLSPDEYGTLTAPLRAACSSHTGLILWLAGPSRSFR